MPDQPEHHHNQPAPQERPERPKGVLGYIGWLFETLVGLNPEKQRAAVSFLLLIVIVGLLIFFVRRLDTPSQVEIANQHWQESENEKLRQTIKDAVSEYRLANKDRVASDNRLIMELGKLQVRVLDSNETNKALHTAMLKNSAQMEKQAAQMEKQAAQMDRQEKLTQELIDLLKKKLPNMAGDINLAPMPKTVDFAPGRGPVIGG